MNLGLWPPWHTPSLVTSEASEGPNYRTVREVLLGAENSSSANQLGQQTKLVTSDGLVLTVHQPWRLMCDGKWSRAKGSGWPSPLHSCAVTVC